MTCKRGRCEGAAPAYADLVRDLLLTPLSAEQGGQLAAISATLLRHLADDASCAPPDSGAATY